MICLHVLIKCTHINWDMALVIIALISLMCEFVYMFLITHVFGSCRQMTENTDRQQKMPVHILGRNNSVVCSCAPSTPFTASRTHIGQFLIYQPTCAHYDLAELKHLLVHALNMYNVHTVLFLISAHSLLIAHPKNFSHWQ